MKAKFSFSTCFSHNMVFERSLQEQPAIINKLLRNPRDNTECLFCVGHLVNHALTRRILNSTLFNYIVVY